jgi:hypothetical protein
MNPGHWGIEHWMLDVCFNEGRYRARKGNSLKNLNLFKEDNLIPTTGNRRGEASEYQTEDIESQSES